MGIFDTRSQTLTYVNAGHEAAYIRRAHTIERLPPTGPMVGILEEVSYASAAALVTTRDVLFLSTDGLTEARDPGGVFLTSSGVEAWLQEADASSAQRLIDTITRRLRRYTRDLDNDDLAMLAVRPTA